MVQHLFHFSKLREIFFMEEAVEELGESEGRGEGFRRCLLYIIYPLPREQAASAATYARSA